MKQYIQNNKGILFVTVTFSLLANIALVLTAKQYEWFFNVVASKDATGFTRLALFAICYIFFIAGLFYVYLAASKKLIKNILIQLRSNLFGKIMNQEMKTYYEQNTSAYLSILTNDINLLEENWIKPMLGICESIGMFATTVILLAYYSPWIMLAIFAASALTLIIPSILGKYLSKRQQRLSKELASFTNKVKNIFSGFDVIHSFNMLPHIHKNFATYNEQLAQRKYETDCFKVVNDTLAQVLGITIQVSTSCLSAYLVLKGEITVGMLAAVIQLCSRFITPLMSIMNHLSLIKSMDPIIHKLDELSQKTRTDCKKEPHFNNAITVSHLHFSYEQAPVLRDVSLTLLPSKKYAIMGESGCGKTTLIKLLLGYYSNFSGSIQYDDDPILALDSFRLNEMVSILWQHVYMFDETIQYNICLQHKYSEKALSQALVQSGCNNILQGGLSLTDPVGENGSNLSGGQRQRIAIARALIRKTPILILDEGTSAVDMQSAYEIENNLLSIQDLTLLSILHKTNEQLLRKYDEIIYMKDGRIAEQGSFDALISNKGAFYKFYTISDPGKAASGK